MGKGAASEVMAEDPTTPSSGSSPFPSLTDLTKGSTELVYSAASRASMVAQTIASEIDGSASKQRTVRKQENAAATKLQSASRGKKARVAVAAKRRGIFGKVVHATRDGFGRPRARARDPSAILRREPRALRRRRARSDP